MTREHTVRIPSGFESKEEHRHVFDAEGIRIELRFYARWIEVKQVWDDQLVEGREGLSGQLDWIQKTVEMQRFRENQK